jgi:hypothetical protein
MAGLINANKVEISIPKHLADKIEKKLAGSGFDSVAGYVSYILEQMVGDLDDAPSRVRPAERSAHVSNADDDEAKIRRRLRDLGYMD